MACGEDTEPGLSLPHSLFWKVPRRLHLTPPSPAHFFFLLVRPLSSHRRAPASPHSGHLTHGVQTHGTWLLAKAMPTLPPPHGVPTAPESIQLGAWPPWVGRAEVGEGDPQHTSPWQPNTPAAAGGAHQKRTLTNHINAHASRPECLLLGTNTKETTQQREKSTRAQRHSLGPRVVTNKPETRRHSLPAIKPWNGSVDNYVTIKMIIMKKTTKTGVNL